MSQNMVQSVWAISFQLGIYSVDSWTELTLTLATTTTFNHGKVTGDINTNSVVIPSVRQSKRQNVNTETKWSRNSTAQT